MKAIILDTETTGLIEPEIVSAAWIATDADEWTLITESRFKPSKPIELGAVATHHIFPQDVELCPPSSSFRLPEGVEYIIGYAVDYDWMAIGSPDVKRIDVCSMARQVYPGLDCYSQTAVFYHLFGMTDSNRRAMREAHGAYADVRTCRSIYEHILLSECGVSNSSDLEEIWRFSEECRIPQVMPFGKYKDLPMSQVPPDYRRWYSGCANPPPDGYILKAFEKYPFIR